MKITQNVYNIVYVVEYESSYSFCKFTTFRHVVFLTI